MTLPSWTPFPGYTKLSLKQIRDEFGCTIIVPTPEIEIERPPLTIPTYPPLPISIGSVLITPTSFDETNIKVGTVTYTINNRRGLTLYAFIHHISTNANDFDGDTRWTINTDSGTFSFTIKTDNITEIGNERFQIVISLDQTYAGGFYVSNELTILDTSTYPRYNPRVLPVSNSTGSYLTTTNIPITISIANAPPNSTFTGKKTFRAFSNFPAIAPWTPNPFPITTQTISATGTWSDTAYSYPVPGEYYYEFNFDNYAPAVIEDGPNRFYQVTANITLGNWRIYPDSLTKIGGDANFTFSYEAPEKTDLRELSWFVVNAGSTTNYAGLGISIDSRGSTHNIRRNNENNSRIGTFRITTTTVLTDQQFEVVLFSGDLNQSTKLAQSQTCTVQVKPLIPDLIVTPSTQTRKYGETINFTLSGSPNEQVEIAYINENLNNQNYLHYFDYYPDVQHAFMTDKFGDVHGLTSLEYADRHFTNYGRAENRKSNTELRTLETGIIRDNVTLLATQSTVANRGNLVVNFASGLSFSNNLLPRQSKYKFSFVGNKALNTKFNPIYAELFITVEPRLTVIGPRTVPYNNPIRVSVFTLGSRTITWTGSTSGSATSDAGGYLDVDISFGATLTTNTLLNWTFNAQDVVLDRNVPYSCTIIETSLMVINKSILQPWQNQLFINSTDNSTYTIKVILGDENKISNKNVVWAVRVGAGSTASLKINNGNSSTMSFDSNNEWNMINHYQLGQSKNPGSDKLEITSPQTSRTLTINITYQNFYERYVYGVVGTTPIDTLQKSVNVGSQVKFMLTGGVGGSPVTTNWIHTPTPNFTQLTMSGTNAINQGTTNLNSSGGWATPDSEFITTFTQPGTYTFNTTFEATENTRRLIVIVNRVYVFDAWLEINNTKSGNFNNNVEMWAIITGIPNERITISAPKYRPGVILYGCEFLSDSALAPTNLTGPTQPTTFRGIMPEPIYYEGVSRRVMTNNYPGVRLTLDEQNRKYLEMNPDVAANPTFQSNAKLHYDLYGHNEGRSWPDFQGYPSQIITLNNDGQGRINLNRGSQNTGEINLVVQSSQFPHPGTYNPEDSFVQIGGTKYVNGTPRSDGGYSGWRGHTMRVFDPLTLRIKFEKQYDTYGETGDSGPAALTNLINDLQNVSVVGVGDLVIINSFDAVRITIGLNQALKAVFGTPNKSNAGFLVTGLSEHDAIQRGFGQFPDGINTPDDVYSYIRDNWIQTHWPCQGSGCPPRQCHIIVGYARVNRLLCWYFGQPGAVTYTTRIPYLLNTNIPLLGSLNLPQYNADLTTAVRHWQRPNFRSYAPAPLDSSNVNSTISARTRILSASGTYKYEFEVSNQSNTSGTSQKISLFLDVTRTDSAELTKQLTTYDPYKIGHKASTCHISNVPPTLGTLPNLT